MTDSSLEIRAASRSTFVSALALLFAALATSSCNAYFNPTVDLVLHVRDVDAGDQIHLAINQFAQRRNLVASPAPNDSPVPEYIRRLNEKTTYYGPFSTEGRALTFLDASPICKVVRVVEGSRKWNALSQADLDELRAALSAIEGVTVEQGAEFEPGSRSKTGRGLDEYCPADEASTPPA